MSKPVSLNIKRVKCYSINDYTGEDDLYGLIGNVRFSIGSFSPGHDYNLDINQLLPAGERILAILEHDITADDILGYIDLSEVMDFDRVVNINGADANYDFTIYVTAYPTERDPYSPFMTELWEEHTCSERIEPAARPNIAMRLPALTLVPSGRWLQRNWAF